MKYLYFLLMLPLLAACGGAEPVSEQTEILRPVRYAQIVSSGTGLDQVFSGTAQSNKEAKLSFKVNGTINRLLAKNGDKVRQGQTIAVMESADYNVQYEQSVANMKSAETQIKSAKSQMINSQSAYQRIEKLYENNSVSLSEFEQAKSAMETAQSSHEAALAQVTASKKQVQSARNQVSYTRLKAPFSGIITAVNVEENEMVGSGTPVAILSTVTEPEIRLGIPEVFIGMIKKGQTVDIEFSTLSGQHFSGTINEVGFSSAGGSTYPLTITIDKPTANIRPGMAANVRFRFGTEKASDEKYLIAPIGAVGESSEGHFVFLLEKADAVYRIKKQPIEIGSLLASGFEIKKGLQAGDLVATAGLSSLLPGMTVQLLDNE